MKTKLSLILCVLVMFSIISQRKCENASAEENRFFTGQNYICDFENYKGTSNWFDNYNLQIIPNGAVCKTESDNISGCLCFSQVYDVAAYLQYNKFETTDKFKLTFDMFFDTIPSSGYIATNGSTITGTRFMNNVVVENGIMKFYSGNVVKETFELKEKTVYSFEYVIDNISKKYSFSVNGNVIAENFSLYRNDVVAFNTIRIGMSYTSEKSGEFCIDNFSFTDYVLVRGNVFKCDDFESAVNWVKTDDGVSSIVKKGNSFLEIPEGKSVTTELLSFGGNGVVAVSVKENDNSCGEISFVDKAGNEVVLTDSSTDSDIWQTDVWNEFVFTVDFENSLITVFKEAESKKEIRIPDDFDFTNVSLAVKCNKEQIYADNFFFMTDERAIKDVTDVFDTMYVNGNSNPSEKLFAGNIALNATIYDKRNVKNAVMLIVHKQEGNIVSINEVPFVYNEKIGRASWCGEITYKRDDTIEAYVWNSISGIVPLADKKIIMQRDEFILHPEEAEYMFVKKSAQHPFIAINKSDIEFAKEVYNSNDNSENIKTLKSYIDSILKEVDELVDADFYDEKSSCFIGYKDTSEYVLYIANKIINYNEILGFSYLLTGDKKYADCIYRILHITGSSEENNEVKYPDWVPSHYLGTAQMSAAFAIGYDWAYNGFDDWQKEEIEKSLYDFGISVGLEGYRNNDSWASYKNNWGMICNSGMLLGAAAIADNELYGEECFEVIASAVSHIENVIDLFNSDGLWQESIGYGKQSLDCLIFAIDTLRNGFGNDFGLMSARGLSKAADAYIYLDGPCGAYNFHDTSYSFTNINGYELLWIGREFNNPSLIDARRKAIKAYSLKPIVMDVLWYSDFDNSESILTDKYFDVMEMFSLRERNFDKNSLWIAAQAGRNNIDHCHLDCGSFVLDWGGYRWATDLGYDDYSLDGYFYTKRYNYYRVRAEGHNTLVINPSTEKDQKIGADTKIEKFVSNDNYAFAVMDLTSAYDAKSVKRGIYLGDGRKSIVIRDEIELNSTDDTVYWYMHTDANINIINNIAYLSKGQKEIQLEFLNEGCDAVIDYVDAKALIKLDGTENDNPNNGIKKVRIKLTNGLNPKLTVKITPVGTGNSFESIKKVTGLELWK